MRSPKVFIIVLQYNNVERTLACLSSLARLTYANFEVVIVDNASRADEVGKLRTYINDYKPSHQFIESPTNKGYAGGNNIGLQYALDHGADYALVLNNDTLVEPNLIENLLAVTESDPRIGIVGPAIREGGRVSYGGRVRWLTAELSHNYKEPASSSSSRRDRALSEEVLRPVGRMCQPDFLTGACVLIKRSVLVDVGRLDQRYFLYFEDADYCLRAKRAGYRLALAPEAVISHSVSSSTNKLGSALLLRYHYRNAHLFNERNAPFIIRFILPIWSLYIIVKQLLKLALRPSTRVTDKAILLGVIDFYRSRFGKIADQS